MAESSLRLEVRPVGIEDLAEKVRAALEAGRFTLRFDTATSPSEDGIAAVVIKARCLVIDLDPPEDSA